jgi:cytochrome c553
MKGTKHCAFGIAGASLLWGLMGVGTAHAAAEVSAACTPPTSMASTPEQTAWQLFVAATCPVNSNTYPYVTWQTWIEQNQLYGGSSAKALAAGERPRFHMSPLAALLRAQAEAMAKKGGKGKDAAPGHARAATPDIANENCNSNTWSKRTICEEARMNPAAQQYITSNSLNTRPGQVAFVNAGTAFAFPAPSVELKADWILLNSCSNLPQGVHVENVGGSCYALGGIHLISKLIDKWIWATFEPQNASTNPQRCVVLGCNDPWGSSPATSKGASTQQTAALTALMQQAALAPEWSNYRLDGVQVDFLDAKGKPTRLGNSVIEGDNAGNPQAMKVSSCITCHNLSSINAQGQEQNPNFIIGAPQPPPAGYALRDFVWSLTLALPPPPN